MVSSVATTSTARRLSELVSRPPALAKRQSRYKGKKPAQSHDTLDTLERPPQTIFERKLAAARKEVPIGIIPVLYMDCDDQAAPPEALEFVENVFHPEGLADKRQSVIACISIDSNKLGVLMRTWDAYEKLVSSPFTRNGELYYWQEEDGYPVQVVATCNRLIELPIIESALREIGNVHNAKHLLIDGFKSSEYSATIVVPHGTKLPANIKIRSFGRANLKIERLGRGFTRICPVCDATSSWACLHDREPKSEPSLNAHESVGQPVSTPDIDSATYDALIPCISALTKLPTLTARSALKNFAELLLCMQQNSSAH